MNCNKQATCISIPSWMGYGRNIKFRSFELHDSVLSFIYKFEYNIVKTIWAKLFFCSTTLCPNCSSKICWLRLTECIWFSIQDRVSVVYISKVPEIREKASQIAIFYTHEANNVSNVTCFKDLQLRVPSTIKSLDTQHFFIESFCVWMKIRLQKPVVSLTGLTVLVRD